MDDWPDFGNSLAECRGLPGRGPHRVYREDWDPESGRCVTCLDEIVASERARDATGLTGPPQPTPEVKVER